MAITPSKVDFNNIDEVQNGDGITPEHINYPLRASALVQSLATTQPDNTNAGNIGTPKVSIDNSSGSPRFKFENLKGATGAKVTGITKVGETAEGIQYQMNFDGASPATFISPAPKKLYITNVVDNTSTYYSIRTVDTDDGGAVGTITFVLG